MSMFVFIDRTTYGSATDATLVTVDANGARAQYSLPRLLANITPEQLRVATVPLDDATAAELDEIHDLLPF